MNDGLDWLGGRGRDGGIDRIPLPVPTGALSLCGKHAIAPDHEVAMGRCGASTVVCLVQRHEIVDRYPAYVTWLEAHEGTRALWHPVPDLHAPTLAEAVVLVDRLVERVRAGEHLLVHCAAGIGRAGTVAACLLVALGMSVDDSLAHVAAHRPMAGPEAGVQRQLVEDLAALHG